MGIRSATRLLAALSLLGATAFGGTAHAQQQTGTITGRVVEATSGGPVPAVQVSVVGTTLGAITAQNGEFTIRNVPAGQARVRAIRVGFTESVQVVPVAAGQTANVTFRMNAAAITLSPVVTTATGEQRRVEVGNAVGQIAAAEVTQTQAVQSVGDLLSARTPGVQVLGGNMTGAGSRVRIRGTSSLSLSNEPIYVIDGIRL